MFLENASACSCPTELLRGVCLEQLDSLQPMRPGSDLEVGQDMHPMHALIPTSESAADIQYHSVHSRDVPKLPLGDPINASVLKATLNAQSLATEHHAMHVIEFEPKVDSGRGQVEGGRRRAVAGLTPAIQPPPPSRWYSHGPEPGLSFLATGSSILTAHGGPGYRLGETSWGGPVPHLLS
jgi:hypothetical protein